ncbi:hypothetical protein [Affinibrenneria salicis]|nr:hypothetical protein [Affinibrenneria salicis]
MIHPFYPAAPSAERLRFIIMSAFAAACRLAQAGVARRIPVGGLVSNLN